MVNLIVTNTVQFLKLYFLHLLDKGELPELMKSCVISPMNVLCTSHSAGLKPKDETTAER